MLFRSEAMDRPLTEIEPTDVDIHRFGAGATAELMESAGRRAAAYLRGISERRIFPMSETIAAVEQLGGPPPERSEDPGQVLQQLDTIGWPATVATTAGRHFGFVVGGAVPAAAVVSVPGAASDQNAAIKAMSPVGVAFEDCRWRSNFHHNPQEAPCHSFASRLHATSTIPS